MLTKPASIAAYLATLAPDRRAALEKLRKTIHALLPDVEECISYSMPAFRHDGHVVAGFIATKQGCSYLPFSGTTLATLAAELRAYEQTKSSLHFDPKRGLPVALVRTLLQARIAETKARSKAKAKAKAKLKTKARVVAAKARSKPRAKARR